MPHVSKRKIDSNVEKQLNDCLVGIIRDLNNTSDTEKFLDSILSSTEKIMIAKRIAVAFLLKYNIEWKAIGKTLKITPETIFRHKLWFESHKEGFEIVFRKMKKYHRNEIAKDLLYQILGYAIKTGSGQIPNPFKSDNQTVKKDPSIY